MRSWWRRVRAALGLGAIWGLATGLVGTVAGGVAGLYVGEVVYLATIGGVITGSLGVALGTGFASLLSLMERNRTLSELSVARGGAWGFVAGAALPLLANLMTIALFGSSVAVGTLIPALLGGAVSYGVLTAALACGTVALAKRAPSELESTPDARGALPVPDLAEGPP